jgi:hypothetical protein
VNRRIATAACARCSPASTLVRVVPRTFSHGHMPQVQAARDTLIRPG